MIRKAKVSDCGTFRYSLSRVWDPGSSVVLFVMLNPSTADAEKDDPTIRKCIGFARSWGYGGLWVVNLFAFRASKPPVMRRAQRNGINIVGPQNGEAISEAAQLANRIVLAWGAHATPWHSYARGVAANIRRAAPQQPILCFGLSKEREPLHPLMLAYSTELQPFPEGV